MALTATKGLYQKVKADEAKIAEQAETIAALTQRLNALEQKLAGEANAHHAGLEPELRTRLSATAQPPL